MIYSNIPECVSANGPLTEFVGSGARIITRQSAACNARGIPLLSYKRHAVPTMNIIYNMLSTSMLTYSRCMWGLLSGDKTEITEVGSSVEHLCPSSYCPQVTGSFLSAIVSHHMCKRTRKGNNRSYNSRSVHFTCGFPTILMF